MIEIPNPLKLFLDDHSYFLISNNKAVNIRNNGALLCSLGLENVSVLIKMWNYFYYIFIPKINASIKRNIKEVKKM